MQQRGFTLVELMVSIVVLAILIAIAVPSFKSQIESSSIRSTTADFITAIAYARSQAVTRGGGVEVVSNNGGNWTDGWCVKTVADADCNDALRVFDGPGGITVTGNGGAASFAFNAQGYVADGSKEFVSLCADDKGKKITILPLGQALAEDCDCSSNVCQ